MKRPAITPRTRAGTSLVELLAATLILGVSIIATFSIWSACGRLILHGRDASMADNIARAEIEEIRVLGYANLTLGARSVQTSLWGTALSTLGTVGGGASAVVGTQSLTTKSFDMNGTSVANGSALAAYTLETDIADLDVLDASTAYEVHSASRRFVRVRVFRVPNVSSPVVTVVTELVQGGL